MDLTGQMKKSRVELLKQKQKVEKMLRGVEAYLEAVGISFADDKDSKVKKTREAVQSLPRKVPQRNVPRGAIEAVQERESLFSWDGKD